MAYKRFLKQHIIQLRILGMNNEVRKKELIIDLKGNSNEIKNTLKTQLKQIHLNNHKKEFIKNLDEYFRYIKAHHDYFLSKTHFISEMKTHIVKHKDKSSTVHYLITADTFIIDKYQNQKENCNNKGENIKIKRERTSIRYREIIKKYKNEIKKLREQIRIAENHPEFHKLIIQILTDHLKNKLSTKKQLRLPETLRFMYDYHILQVQPKINSDFKFIGIDDFEFEKILFNEYEEPNEPVYEQKITLAKKCNTSLKKLLNTLNNSRQ